MADNISSADLAALTFRVASDKVTYSSDIDVDVQLIRQVKVSGAEGVRILGSLNFHKVAAGLGDAVNIKGTAGLLHSITCFNKRVSAIYVKVHDVAGAPTPGAAVWRTFGFQAGNGRPYIYPGGLPFSTGLGLTIVLGIDDGDATAVTASDCVVDVEYT